VEKKRGRKEESPQDVDLPTEATFSPGLEKVSKTTDEASCSPPCLELVPSRGKRSINVPSKCLEIILSSISKLSLTRTYIYLSKSTSFFLHEL